MWVQLEIDGSQTSIQELSAVQKRLKKRGHKRLSEASHSLLIELYGKTEGLNCKDCQHFYFNRYGRRYPKCRISGCTGSNRNHDWAGRWQACGKFVQKMRVA